MSFADESVQDISLMQSDSMMCGKLEHTTSNQLTLFAEDSPARTLATPENAKGLTEKGLDYGENSIESFAKYDHDSSSWKTSQLCFTGELSEFLENWPRAGMTRNGIVCPLQPSAPLTNETEALSWPTPRAANPGSRPNGHGKNPLGRVMISLGLRKRGKKRTCLLAHAKERSAVGITARKRCAFEEEKSIGRNDKRAAGKHDLAGGSAAP